MNLLESKYGFILSYWGNKTDDRRIAYNMCKMILEADKECAKLKNTFCRVAIRNAIREQEQVIDGIIYRFTWLKWNGYTWEEKD